MEFAEAECLESMILGKKTSKCSILSIYVRRGGNMSSQIYKDIYLDNAATTQMTDEVEAAMQPYLKENFGNASTMYSYGEDAKAAMEEARKTIAGSLMAKPSEIYFTSGGSESDNWAVKGIAGALKEKGRHIITSRIEHHAILNSCEYLERLGYEVTYLDVDSNGMISVEELEQAIRQDTTLITIMFGNNEIGTIQPIMEIGRIAREHQVLFHTDAVQAYAQIPISVRQYPVDLLSASAHKFHGPKGVGFLYVREGVQIPSFIHGGGQEQGKRAGTENVAGIVGMGKAAELAHCGMRQRIRRETMLRNYLMEKVTHEIPGVRINGHRIKRLPGNVSMSFEGVDGASLLILLDEDGICASGGSACNTGESRVSYVIAAIGVPEEYAAGTIRMTLCGNMTRNEIDAAVESLKRGIKLLRDS